MSSSSQFHGPRPTADTYRGNSTAYTTLNKKEKETTAEKWEKLPAAAKAGVYAGGAGVVALGVGALAFLYLRAKRAGTAEAKAADEKAQAERHELMGFKGGEDTTNQGHEYSSGGWTRL